MVRSHIWFQLRQALQLRSALFRIDQNLKPSPQCGHEYRTSRGSEPRMETSFIFTHTPCVFVCVCTCVCGGCFETWHPATQRLFWKQQITSLHAVLMSLGTVSSSVTSVFFFLQIFLFSGFRTFLYCRDAFFELFLSDVEKSIRSNRDRLQIRFLS